MGVREQQNKRLSSITKLRYDYFSGGRGGGGRAPN